MHYLEWVQVAGTDAKVVIIDGYFIDVCDPIQERSLCRKGWCTNTNLWFLYCQEHQVALEK